MAGWLRTATVGVAVLPLVLAAGCLKDESGGLPGAFGSDGQGAAGDGIDDDGGRTTGGTDTEGGGADQGGDDADPDDEGPDDGPGESSGTAGCVAEEEVCDGIDNDCDDEVDEDDPMLDADCDTGDEGICAAGALFCDEGTLVCAETTKPVAEVCNGIDDDCDGNIDNGDPEGGEDCDTTLLGVCAAGMTTCASDGSVACEQLVTASTETCNGLDDDCDGTADDGIGGVGNACSSGLLGPCAAGTFQCNGTVIECQPTVQPALSETCGNGIDDDCDGTVDDGCGCAHTECMTGVALTPACGACVANVCAFDPFCCDTSWDATCVNNVTLACSNSCFCAHGVCATGVALNPFCDTCVDLVCFFDAFCCATSWDGTCVLEAASFCGAPC